VSTADPAEAPVAPPLSEFLAARMAERSADGRNLAVLLIECGVIGRIDAVWGYEVGDAVRNRVISMMRADVLRPGDFAGEIGRDDLACVLSTIEGPAVALLAAEKALRVLNAPFWIGDDEIFASPSIGTALYPAHGESAGALLQKAKSAAVLARDLTGHIADYSDAVENPAASALLFENRLRTAVAEDALELVFQPQYDLRLGQVMGAEGLLRWRDPAMGMIDAVRAFAAAEAAGFLRFKSCLPDLIKLAQAPDTGTTLFGMLALERIGDAQGIPAAQALVTHPDLPVRQAAMRLLCLFTASGTITAESLLAANDERSIRLGIELYGRIGTPEALSRIGPYLSVPSVGQRIQAMLAVDGRCPAEFRGALAALKIDPDPTIKAVASRIDPVK
jgi:GGDEF domain-containing protein